MPTDPSPQPVCPKCGVPSEPYDDVPFPGWLLICRPCNWRFLRPALAGEAAAIREQSPTWERDVVPLREEIERLNEMLRKTGYGQGQIDAYVSQCEELASRDEEIAGLRELLKQSIYAQRDDCDKWTDAKINAALAAWRPEKEQSE